MDGRTDTTRKYYDHLFGWGWGKNSIDGVQGVPGKGKPLKIVVIAYKICIRIAISSCVCISKDVLYVSDFDGCNYFGI